MQREYALTEAYPTTASSVVSIINLKTWARRNLPKDHPLRAIIEVENDELSSQDFRFLIPRLLRLAEVD